MAFCLRNNDLFEECILLRYKVKDQYRIIAEFESGERYKKLQQDHHKVIQGYNREIKKLHSELADAYAQAVDVRKIWTDECEHIWDEYQAEVRRKDAEIDRLQDKDLKLQQKYDKDISALRSGYEDRLYEKDCIIEKLKNELAHDEALLGRYSDNTGLPTSQTPLGKKKRIPNTREKTGRPKGGQPGHKKHVLSKPAKEEITDKIDHPLTEEACCPTCESTELRYTGEYEEKYEYDIEVQVKKKLHRFWLYECQDCGEIVRCGVAPGLRAECQYGENLQALALSLINTVNAPINKAAMFLDGITGSELTPCEGYIAKHQKRSAKKLTQFREDLRLFLITRDIVDWDDTVVCILAQRACLRFYGDEKIAF